MFGIILFGVPWLAILVGLILLRHRRPSFAYAAIAVLLAIALVPPAIAYLATGDPVVANEQDWPPAAVAGIVAWASLFLADILGFAATGILLGTRGPGE